MKATTIIIAAVLSIQISTLFAANEFPLFTPNNDAIASRCVISLVPSVPAEATFEDIATIEANDLMPTTPTEATFEDMTSEMSSFVTLVPEAPPIADFSDSVEMTVVNNGILAPVTPLEANFD